jgi:hypothetical protein
LDDSIEDINDLKFILVNPLEKLTDEQIAGLWGVSIDVWSDAISQKVQKINPARACVSLNSGAATGPAKSLPPLPEKLTHLIVYENSSEGIKDYAPLARLTQLKFFSMRSMSIRDLDAVLLKDSTSLQYLCLQGQNLQHPEALGSLHSLRCLDLMWATEFQDLSFAKNLTELRTLDINHTNVADLTPLSELAHLTDVNANQAPVEHLPSGKLAALKSLKIMSSKLAEADVNTFKTAHPNCKVEFGWAQSFRDALSQCTRLRVRKGGTDGHSRNNDETTIFETKDAKEISDVIEQTKINEAASGFHCMCGGEPTFEFYNNDKMIVVVGFHHGRSLRWKEGWPGDAMLTPESSKFYCEYLAAHGVKGPQEELEKSRLQEAARDQRFAVYKKLIPENVWGLMTAATDEDTFKTAFTKNIPDATTRALLYFQIYGCDQGAWNHSSGLDDPIQKILLPSVTQEELSAALPKILDNPAAANGAARWFFSDGKWASLEAKTRDDILSKLATPALSHPREINRRRTLRALGEIKGAACINVLRSVLAGNIKPRELPKDETTEPGGMVSFGPNDSEVKKEVSDSAYAALILSKLGDKESLAAIRTLVEKAQGEEKTVLETAIKNLTENK